jgi:hypothetical protein
MKLRLLEVPQRLPRDLLLLLGRFNGSNQRRIARIWWRLGFDGFQALRAKFVQWVALFIGVFR